MASVRIYALSALVFVSCADRPSCGTIRLVLEGSAPTEHLACCISGRCLIDGAPPVDLRRCRETPRGWRCPSASRADR